jgi:hypothetical protein
VLPKLRAQLANMDRWPIEPESVPSPQSQREEKKRDTALSVGNDFDEKVDSLTSMFAMLLYVRATADRQEKLRAFWAKKGWGKLLEMMGYSIDEVEPDDEPIVNPEEEAHADQESVDAAFYDLLGGLEI